MTRLLLTAALISTAFAGCEGKSDPPKTTTVDASPLPASPTPAPDAATATTTTGGDASGAAATTAVEAPASGETKNVLGLKLPKIDKRPNWQYGVPQPDPFPATFDAKKDYFATIKTTLGDMTVKFFPELAPKHVTSFIYLSEIGYYDDAPFHRVCEGFMMQGGDPSGQGTGGPGYRVPAEFNPRKHVKGILSMARTNDPNSAGSQFFVMFDPAPFLDNKYTVFGQVVEGMNVVDQFEQKVAVKDPAGRCVPKSLEKIKTVTVFTKEKK